MRLGGRLAAAIEIITDIEARHRPASDALRDWGLNHRFAGAGDRAAIGNIVYDALRWKRSAAWLLDSDAPRAAALGAVALGTGRNGAQIAAALEGDRFAPPQLEQDEIEALDGARLGVAPDEVRADCPDWCVPMVSQVLGADWPAELAAMARRPPLDLRVNTLEADRDTVLAELKGTGAARAELAPNGIRIPPIDGDGRHPNVQAEPAFQKGWFEVQDEGSQIVAHLAGAEAGMQVLDYCAGAGGKTLALSAAMDNRGQIFAHDSEKQRLAPIFDRLRRAGARNVQTVAGSAGLEPLAGQMDIVLVDAPCTGSGTWRRRPDAKWRLSERQLGVRIEEQATILDAARAYVKPGGRLAYITCSIFAEENQHQVAAFVSANTDFAPVDHAALWAAAFPAGVDKVRVSTEGLTLTPQRTGTDGFFISVMERRA